MKILIFGTGNYYQNRKKMISSNVEVIGFVDNNIKMQYIEGIKVFYPNEIVNIDFDYVVLMSLMAWEMKEQLLSIGINPSKIKLYEELLQIVYGKQMTWHYGNRQNNKEKKALIAYGELGYDGGSITAIRAAQVLSHEYMVDVAVTYVDKKILHDLNNYGINVLIYPSLYMVKYDENGWINDYDMVIANTIKMLEFALNVSNYKKVLLWLHDPMPPLLREKNKKNIHLSKCNNLKIVAVGDIAKNNFESVFGTEYSIDILKYGVPDTFQNYHEIDGKIIFTLIGWASPIKGQDILISAVQKLTSKERQMFEIWFVGDWENSGAYCTNLKRSASECDNIKILGKLNREEMENLYSNVDVVVSSSREDVLPIVQAEGMMNEKLCISSDATGIAKYIIDGHNGLVFESENVDALAEKIRWVLNNKDKISIMGKKARETYLKEFSMQQFEHGLYSIIESMKKNKE